MAAFLSLINIKNIGYCINCIAFIIGFGFLSYAMYNHPKDSTEDEIGIV